MKKLLSLLIIATIITSSLCVSYFAIDDNSTQNNTESTTVPVTETSSTVTTEPVTESSTDTSSTEPTDIKVNSIKLNTDDYVMYSKQYVQLKATVSPDNATNNNVTWKSSNRNIATVDSKGKVKALKVGNAIITATSVDGSNISAQCKIKVAQRVTKIKLNKGIINLSKKGKTCTVKATVYPNNAYNKYVNWTANNKKVATVDKNGKIKATTNKGTTYVNAIAKDGSKIRTRVLVVVGEKVKKITLNKTSVTLNRGAKNRTFQLKKAIKNKNATYKGVSWYSSNKNIATVNSTGKVTLKRRGKVVITVKARDGSNTSARCTITVKQLVTKITFNKKNKYNVDYGKSITLKTAIEPSDASIKTLKWKSSNSKVLTVNQKGKVTAKGLGSAVITASATDGSGVKVSHRVSVNVTMNTKLTHKQFVSNKKYVDMYCKALNDYFESCGAVINPNMVGYDQWCVHDTSEFSDNMKIYDFMVESVGLWTCRMAKDNINNNESWKDLKKGKSLLDFLEEISRIGSSNMPTYNPKKMLDANWNGWNQFCEYKTSDRIMNIYVYPSKINISAGTEYIIYMYWDTNMGLQRKGIPLVKE
nr:Ig-like domain-containing protein [uncultured Ruminococcus sp.]